MAKLPKGLAGIKGKDCKKGMTEVIPGVLETMAVILAGGAVECDSVLHGR